MEDSGTVKGYTKDDLAKIGIDVARLLPLITRIDEDCDPDSSPDNPGTLLEEPFEDVVARLTPVFDATGDMWGAFIDESKESIEEKVVGYWNCVALDDEHQKAVEEGKLLESYININNLKTDLKREKNEILFDSVCLHKEYQRRQLSGIVMKSIYDTMSRLPSKGIQVGSVWASVWSNAGIRFFEKKLGFAVHVENTPEGVTHKEGERHYIYRISFDDFIKNLEAHLTRYGLLEKR